MAEMPLFERLEKGDHDEEERVYRVGEVNRAVRATLEDQWRSVLIEGELSDVRAYKNGHVYFSLNDEDENAQLRGVMFASDARRTKAPLEDGARIRFRGTLSLYTARGQFQLIARSAWLAGEGRPRSTVQETAREARGRRAARPRPKARPPGAAASRRRRDQQVRCCASRHHARRFRALPRTPPRRRLPVQGETAPATIVRALELVQRVDDLDVVIVSRGGGSAEDLWAFNDEGVARAIAGCRVPVVSGVGHEVDITIADLVADVRAATPSNAAEIVVPEHEVLLGRVESLERRLMQTFDNLVRGHRLRLERSLRPLYGARRVIAPIRRELGELEADLVRGVRAELRARRSEHTEFHHRLMRLDPRSMLRRDRRELDSAVRRLRDAARLPVQTRRERLAGVRATLLGSGRPLVRDRRAAFAELCTHLDAISPLRVLDRGYAIALSEKTGRAVRKVDDVNEGDLLRIRVSDGEVPAKVES